MGMHKRFPDITVAFVLFAIALSAGAQSAPASPDKPWHGNAEAGLNKQLSSLPDETPEGRSIVVLAKERTEYGPPKRFQFGHVKGRRLT